jgi:hypothetical protein
VHGKPIVAVLGMWSGAPDDGDAATGPFRRLAEPVVDLFGPMPYLAMQSQIDPLYPRAACTTTSTRRSCQPWTTGSSGR